MLSFDFTLDNNGFAVKQSGLVLSSSNQFDLYTHGLSKQQISEILNLKQPEDLYGWFNNCSVNQFCAFVYFKDKKKFFAFNDLFGHFEIYIENNGKSIRIFSDVSEKRMDQINRFAIFEFLSFQTVAAPRTIYEGIEIVPLGSVCAVDFKRIKYDFYRYWKAEELFNPKEDNYDTLIEVLRRKFYDVTFSEYTKKSAVSLSGGIDSGGILSILSDASNEPVSSFSFGPYGKSSGDLQSSRKTAKALGSKNSELYPSNQMFKNVIFAAKHLNQPIASDFIFASSDIYRVASEEGIDKLFFGYGVDMMLGNMNPNSLWERLRFFESLTPPILRRPIYSLLSRLFGLSQNAEEILLADSWMKRFFHMQAPLFTREKGMYKNLPEDFYKNVTEFLEPVFNNSSIALSDRFILMVVSSWMNYGQQERMNAMLGKVYGITAFSPHNTLQTAKVILKVSNKTRKINNWDKQIWRDVLRPYVPEHLYERKEKSFTVPYTKVLSSELQTFLPYIKENKLLKDVIDFDWYEENFHTLPESGLNLLRLVGLAIWFDVRTESDNLRKLDKAMEQFDFSKAIQ